MVFKVVENISGIFCIFFLYRKVKVLFERIFILIDKKKLSG